ncbi:hypothetical protein BGW38_002355 [Lunasporangiospora selenospora]|uniref:RlpA-like protein double-psi beta-barrel domain-containing protein n=1 Tax=Lunasporangiospora selenospora TaxID=979761 RepID=A0A9P6FUB0_9FUNG|nr:hypothetical protein BGW38_002355 [Lunasporangiospora selenospora]
MIPSAFILVFMASSLMNLVLSAPLPNTHSGYGTAHTRQNHRCPDIEYSLEDRVIALSSAQFYTGHDSNACGLYAKMNRQDDPSKHYYYKVVDLCKDCDKHTVALTRNAMREFTDSNGLLVDWELVRDHNKNEETDQEDKSHRHDKDEDDTHKNKVYRGRGTWFSDTYGSCEESFSQSDLIVAVNEAQMGEQYGKYSKCGQQIRVTARGYPGKSVIVRVVDTCPYRHCNYGHLDLSRAAFQKFAPLSVGVLDLEWSFL